MKTQAAVAEIELPIGGMTCVACARAIERQLGSREGVTNAAVNFAARTATVHYLADRTEPDKLIAAVEDIGYEVPRESPEIAEARELSTLRRRLFAGVVFTIPLAILGMTELWPALQFALSLPVLFYAGRPFFADAWTALRHRSANMNTLIALGTGTAFAYSVWVLLTGGMDVYFEAAAVIVVLVLLGRLLESRARGRASGAIRKLMNLQPSMARVVRDGGEFEVPVAEIAPGDIVGIRPGERIAVDGRVQQGSSEVNEAMLTGESLPAAKHPGSTVFAGTHNGTGAFQYRATKVGRATALARIVDLVKKAQGSKAPSARMADIVSGYFTMAVLTVAAITFIVWIVLAPVSAALTHAVAVLIVACPCAMGLATPAALIAGTGRGAEQGILFKNGEALEAAARVRTIVLDKTGTITTGHHRVIEANASAEVIAMAAAVERQSEHPIARAIVRFAGPVSLPLTSGFRAIPGSGAEAFIDGQRVFVGRGDAGSVQVEIDGRREGTFLIADEVKPEARAAIARLVNAGFEVWMITGDHTAAALQAAHESGIDPIRTLSQVLPGDKDAAISRLRAEGKRVAMVGDGINDAPALARADVGLAIGTGTDVAIESAGIILTSGNLEAVPDALLLARRTLRVIRQNLFWAFAYNAAAIPLAAGLLYPFTGWTLSPMIASAAMALSSVSVVMNSLRLAR